MSVPERHANIVRPAFNGPITESATARFWKYVAVSDGCWEWTGAHDQMGYGAFDAGKGPERRKTRAHRFSYILKYGPVPDGLVLDHFVCDNKGCVNPDHVRPASYRENNLRSPDNLAAINTGKERCLRGHEYDRLKKNGGRACGTCLRDMRNARRTEAAIAKRYSDALAVVLASPPDWLRRLVWLAHRGDNCAKVNGDGHWNECAAVPPALRSAAGLDTP